MSFNVFAFRKSIVSEMIVANDDVPQTQPISANQVQNSAGGFTFKLDDIARVRRFLILGCEGGTYYTSERKLGLENAACIQQLIDGGRGPEVVREIVDCSTANRAPKQQPLIFALAMCARSLDAETQQAAYQALGQVCRIPTALFNFIDYCETLSVGTGWSRSHKRAISQWYTSKSASSLAFLMSKYKQRDGWSHRDVLRLAHIKPPTDEHDMVFRSAAKGFDSLVEVAKFAEVLSVPDDSQADPSMPSATDDSDVASVAPGLHNLAAFLTVLERSKTVTDAAEMVQLIRTHGLVREHVPTPLLSDIRVWEALLDKMPMTAMIRNLGKMTSIGLLASPSKHVDKVVAALRDEEKLRSSKIHPFSVLLALSTYRNGHGDKGSLSWQPVQEILKALEFAFYAAFRNVTPTNQRVVLAMDVSGSMSAPIQGSSISAREGAAAMAMLFARTEPNHCFMAFCDDFVELDITAQDSLDAVLKKTSSLPFGGTDCSLPMLWALENSITADCFIVLTDNETYAGSIQPHVALQRYRQMTGIDAKLVVVGMTATGFTIADPDDVGMLDVVGFDASAPEIVHEFMLGRL